MLMLNSISNVTFHSKKKADQFNVFSKNNRSYYKLYSICIMHISFT